MDVGVTIELNDLELYKMSKLSNIFNLKFNKKTNKSIAFSSVVNIQHNKPLVTINTISKPLLFSKIFCSYLKTQWKEPELEISFIGLITEKRRKALTRINNIHIFESERGRHFPSKAFDEYYYSILLKSRYTLCLDGDFIWTYRFFEACLLGSIPIIENTCNLYNDFITFTIDDYNNGNIHYDTMMITHNYNMAVKTLTIDNNLLKSTLGL